VDQRRPPDAGAGRCRERMKKGAHLVTCGGGGQGIIELCVLPSKAKNAGRSLRAVGVPPSAYDLPRGLVCSSQTAAPVKRVRWIIFSLPDVVGRRF
jgi:hypothetical protein